MLMYTPSTLRFFATSFRALHPPAGVSEYCQAAQRFVRMPLKMLMYTPSTLRFFATSFRALHPPAGVSEYCQAAQGFVRMTQTMIHAVWRLRSTRVSAAMLLSVALFAILPARSIAEPVQKGCYQALSPGEEAPPGKEVTHGMLVDEDGTNPEPVRVVRSGTCFFRLVPRTGRSGRITPPDRTAEEQIAIALGLIRRIAAERAAEGAPLRDIGKRQPRPRKVVCPESLPFESQRPSCTLHSPLSLDRRSAA